MNITALRGLNHTVNSMSLVPLPSAKWNAADFEMMQTHCERCCASPTAYGDRKASTAQAEALMKLNAQRNRPANTGCSMNLLHKSMAIFASVYSAALRRACSFLKLALSSALIDCVGT